MRGGENSNADLKLGSVGFFFVECTIAISNHQLLIHTRKVSSPRVVIIVDDVV